MKKGLEQEPELRLLLEDYPKKQRGEFRSGPSFGSPEPDFLLGENSGKVRRWLADQRPAPDAADDDTPLRLLVEDYHPAERFRERRSSRPVPAPEPGPEPDFLVAWDSDVAATKRSRQSRAASFGLHLVMIIAAAVQPYTPRFPEPTEPDPGKDATRISLTAPSPELMEQLAEAARGDEGESQQQTVAAAPDPIVAPEVRLEPTPAPPMQPLLPEPEAEPEPEAVAQVEEPEPDAPPEPDAARSPAPGEFQAGTELAEEPEETPATTAAPQERPQLRLESVRARMPAPEGPVTLGELKLSRGRDQMVEAAAAQLSNQGSVKQAVGDGVGAAAIGGYAAPSRGNIGSGLELLSDPKGVDFRPYLLQILNSVRRNWFAVIPESARLGVERGRVALQFSIAKTGDVPKLVIASSSRSVPLDRASVAGVSASLPFPPLPTEFTGDEIRVQFVFLYNTK